MRPYTSTDIRGNWATLLLPIQADDSIDYALLAEEIDRFIAARVSGIYSNGSAGEFYTQTEEEFDRVNALLAEKCERAGMPFQVGACHMSPQLSLHRVRRARQLRPAAMQVVLPDWFSPSWPEIEAFLERLCAEASPVPLVVYNPPHAKRRLTPEECIKISDTFPSVAGFKLPGGDEEWYRAMRPIFRRCSVFIPGHLLASGLSKGAHGAYSNVACLNPKGAQRWYERCLSDPEGGALMEKRIHAFWMAHVAPLITRHGLANMAADKAAATAGGWLPGITARMRWPYRCADAALVQALGEAARREVPELFD